MDPKNGGKWGETPYNWEIIANNGLIKANNGGIIAKKAE